MHKWRLSFFLKMNKIDASVELTKCLISSFAKTSSKYCLKFTNSVFNKLYNDSYNDSAVILIAWLWSLCKSNLTTFSVKNTSSYSFNLMSKVYVSSAFVIQLVTLFITFTECLMIDSLMMLIMTRVYTVNSSYKAFANACAKNNSNTCSFTLKHHVLMIMFFQICLNCILDILRIRRDSFLLIA